MTNFLPEFHEMQYLYEGIVDALLEEGNLKITYKNGHVQTLGPVTAYAYAIEHGYEGTEENFAQDIAKIGEDAEIIAEALADIHYPLTYGEAQTLTDAQKNLVCQNGGAVRDIELTSAEIDDIMGL